MNWSYKKHMHCFKNIFFKSFDWTINCLAQNKHEEVLFLPNILKEGKWETVKEVLDYVFNGITRTMQLPKEKILKTKADTKQHVWRRRISSKELERPNECLRRAALAMPWPNGLFAPINNMLLKNVTTRKLRGPSPLKGALRDFSTIASVIEAEPTPLPHQESNRHKRTSLWYDSTPTTSWMRRLSTK